MTATAPTITTGIPGLDDVLAGGLPPDRIYLVQGDPGVGKTTMGLQFLLAGLAKGEPCLYVSLSESRIETQAVAASHGWNIEKLKLHEVTDRERTAHLGSEDNTVFHPAEVELRELMQSLLSEVERIKPTRVVFDSLSEVRMLSQSPLQYRRQVMELKNYFATRAATVLLLDDRSQPDGDLLLQSLAHGVLSMEQLPQSYGPERRRLRMVKLRGRKFRGGYHDYKLERGGLVVFPRLVASEHERQEAPPALSSGLGELDALLGGGLDSGTSTLVLGPAGTGKSSLAVHYAAGSARQGRKALVFCFDEARATLFARAHALGLDLESEVEAGRLRIRQIDPAELAPDELMLEIRQAVETEGFGFVCIDSLNGYLNAMPDEKFLLVQLHELLTYLSHKGVVTMMVMAQHGLLGTGMQAPVDISYVADTVVMLRYFESQGRMRKALSVLKKRSGPHEDSIRELSLSGKGLRVGEPLQDFHGVLTGVPSFHGSQAGLNVQSK